MQTSVFALSAALAFALSACGSGSESSTNGAGGDGGTNSTTSSQGGSGTGGNGTGGAMTGGGGSTQTGTSSSTNNGFPDQWPDGVTCAGEPDFTVWAYDDDTFILRQSLCTNFEGPFLYLFFGEDKAFLQDTGTGDANVAAAVTGIIDDWLAKHGKSSIPLIVTHSHSHGDHTGGDNQLKALPFATVVGTAVNDVQTFFGISNWPAEIVAYELGNRSLDIIPIPGHQNAHIAVYDKSRGLLLTGDTLYPGRLYISNWASYGASIQRLADFAASPEHPLTWVLGTHIEMTTTPGQDYAMGASKHPDEHVLQLTHATLTELHQAVMALGGNPMYQKHDDFIIYPL